MAYLWNGRERERSNLEGLTTIFCSNLEKDYLVPALVASLPIMKYPVACTSVKVKGVHYTAHPLHRNEHPWHYLVYIEWEGYD
jgi:hypothetical protein